VILSLAQLASLLHGFWRALPRDLRRRTLYDAIDLAAPRAEAPRRLKPGPVIVGGALSTASGLGESARLCLDALRALGWDPGHLDVGGMFLRSDLKAALPGRQAVAGEGGTLVLHINGPYMPYVMLRLGRRFLAGRRIVGYWAWELPRMGPDWRQGLSRVHEIWVPSRFTAESLPPDTEVPVRIVPHPVAAEPAKPLRERFGVGPSIFTVLSAFDMGSSYTRKNPKAAIAAFRRAFGDDPRCRLLLKIGHAGDADWAMDDLGQAIAGMTNVELIEETLSRAEMTGLIAGADAVLSLHRAEGFGLLMAEAMLQGVPAVATGWSGNLDFMTKADSALIGYRLIPVEDPQGTYAQIGAEWAEPDIDEAATWLRRLRDDAELRQSLATRGREAAAERLSLAAYRRAIGDSLPPPDPSAATPLAGPGN
jgi:glycosyltransferase involved in cell wall biosynthesis